MPRTLLNQHMTSDRVSVGIAGLDDVLGGGLPASRLYLVHGTPGVGADRRTLRVTKLRGSSYRTGNHDFVIQTGGVRVYPRLVAAEHRSTFGIEPMSIGLAELDQLLGGGLDRGAATLLMGPAGTGKSGIAMQFACAAAERGECVSMFLFEERMGTFHARAASLGMPITRYIDQGLIRLQQIDPAEIPPDQFTDLVRQGIEQDGAKLLVVDSMSGYLMAMPDRHALSLQLHELLAYTGDQGVAAPAMLGPGVNVALQRGARAAPVASRSHR